MELDTINKLYLELSQVATAKTARELTLEQLLRNAKSKNIVKCPPPHWEDRAAQEIWNNMQERKGGTIKSLSDVARIIKKYSA